MQGTTKSLNIASLVAFVVGITTLVAGTWIAATTPDRPMSMRPILLGVAVMLLAVVLQVARHDVSSPAASREPTSAHALKLPLAIFATPIVIAWLQFELRLDVVWMFPLITLAGGVWSGAVLGRLLAPRRLPGVGTLLGVALVGIPAGLMGFSLPMQHFNTHMTDVRVLELDDQPPIEGEPPKKGYYRFSAELPPFPEIEDLEVDVTDEAEAPLLEIGEPVELGTLLERGDAEMIDGELYVRQPDGTMRPAVSAETMQDMLSIIEDPYFDPSRSRDAAREANRRWTAEIERLRRSGRIFSGP
ncbi:MAG: hypothetical protein AB1Z98_20350 [Nannocystaceae bacterium]